eukprot:g1184.t1
MFWLIAGLILLNVVIFLWDTKTVPTRTLKFAFTVLTDLALVPALFTMARYRRHFEMFVGILQVLSALSYNICNALNVSIFLAETEWHKMNNVLAFTYFALLCIHLMGSDNEDLNIVLRYVAFASIAIGQVKDNFWAGGHGQLFGMGGWTFLPVAVFASLPLFKFARYGLPAYDLRRTLAGLVMFALAGACFRHAQDPGVEGAFRHMHGLFHLFIGAALWCLWGIVPDPESQKKKDAKGKVSLSERSEWA